MAVAWDGQIKIIHSSQIQNHQSWSNLISVSDFSSVTATSATVGWSRRPICTMSYFSFPRSPITLLLDPDLFQQSIPFQAQPLEWAWNNAGCWDYWGYLYEDGHTYGMFAPLQCNALFITPTTHRTPSPMPTVRLKNQCLCAILAL